MKRSAVVQALADVASQGTYQVRPEQARQMNTIFELAARLINELEQEEQQKQAWEATLADEEEDNDDSE